MQGANLSPQIKNPPGVNRRALIYSHNLFQAGSVPIATRFQCRVVIMS
jgi:hypothetical protein